MRPPLRILLLVTLAIVFRAHAEEPRLRITLHPDDPASSRGVLLRHGTVAFSFPVGLGRHGVLPEGSRFRSGYSLLGRFRIQAILSDDRFEMAPAMIRQSEKSSAWLAEHLFPNMSSIDFDGDGSADEYGEAYIALAPQSTIDQPFSFQTYRGTYRWYGFALHGTPQEDRIGKCITGGCINIGREDLRKLLPELRLGDRVEIRSAR